MIRAFAVVALALVVCAPVLAKGGASMRMTVASPATIQGSGFQPREVVRLVLRTSGKAKAHRLLTTPAGHFSSIWKGVAVDLCSSWSLTATGSKGSHAAIHSRANPCPTPPPID